MPSKVLTPGARTNPVEHGFARPPVVLTFLAPADRCNQRCPECILDQVSDPVSQFDLSPADYALFVEQFAAAEIPILTLSFQGYEVTLPSSWPYVEAVFGLAKQHGLRRSFVTNGMLLDRYAERLDDLRPDRIAVSLDGASPESNDRLRGLRGAFNATTHGLRRLIARVPDLRDRITVLSTLYDEDNVRSLAGMPRLLRDLGLSQWMVSCALQMTGDMATPVRDLAVLRDWFARLGGEAARANISFHVSDEFGLLDRDDRARLKARRVFNLDFLYRLDPTGGIRVGADILRPWHDSDVRRWNPRADNAVEVSGYVAAEAAFARKRSATTDASDGQGPSPGT